MTRPVSRSLKKLVFLFCAALSAAGCSDAPPPRGRGASNILRIGYATDDGVIVWGEVGQIFERTNILKKNGINARIKRYPDTTDMLRAIRKNEIDAALTATGVVMCAIIADCPVEIVALLGGGGRNALITASNSGIKTTADLKRKTVLDPIVGALLFRFLKNAGLKPEDVNIISEYSYGAEANDKLLRGEIDALMAWDPFFITLEKQKKIRVLTHDPYHLEALINAKFARNKKQTALNFEISLKEAVFFMLTHQDLANRWYSEISGIPVGQIESALAYSDIHNETKRIAAINGFSLMPTDAKIQDIQNVADAMRDYGVIGNLKKKFSNRPGRIIKNNYETTGIPVRDFFNFELIRDAEKRLSGSGYAPSTVTY